MNNQSSYPWNFLREYAKYHIILLVITLGVSVIIYRTHVVKWIEKNELEMMTELLGEKALLLQSHARNTWCDQLKSNKYKISITSDNSFPCSIKNDELGTEDTLKQKFKNSEVELEAQILSQRIKENIASIDKALAIIFGPILLLFVGVYTFVGIHLARPLKRVLYRLSTIEEKLPYEQKLGLFYKHDEWSKIEAIIKKTEVDIEEQSKKLKDEGLKTLTLLESITDEIVAVDLFENSIFYNKNFASSFAPEVEPGSSIKLWKIFPNEIISGHFKSVIKSGTPKSLKAIKLIQKADNEQYFDVAIAPLYDGNKNITGAIGAFHDVTEAKLTEQMRVDFVANVSHEMRTPLTSIKGFAQLIQGMEIPDNLKPYLQKIVFNTDRLIGLFNDLLNLSVIESQNDILLEPTHLSEILDEIKDSLSPIYKEKELLITSSLQVDIIYVDKKLFEQALINLIDNACKYTFKNTQVEVTSFLKDNQTVITISDNGPGISKEHLGRIFERFYRVDSTRAQAKGTGLGLSIVKHIISKHKGKVWAESELQQGTSFFIEIPNEFKNSNLS